MVDAFKNERLKNQGRLLEAEQKEKELELRLDGLIANIRDCADPLTPLAEIPGEELTQHALNFSQRQIEYLGVIREINVIKRALGA